jgi:hypothetical protein
VLHVRFWLYRCIRPQADDRGTAVEDTLTQVPGIGRKKAGRIRTRSPETASPAGETLTFSKSGKRCPIEGWNDSPRNTHRAAAPELEVHGVPVGIVLRLQRGVFEPFERRRRVFTPSSAAFAESGRVLAAVAAREGWRLLDDQPSLPNDALIAASCREQGITLITKDGDFKRLARFVKGFRYAAP